MFLEVSDSAGSSGWSCFVSHRLAVVNQRDALRSLVKESQVQLLRLTLMACEELTRTIICFLRCCFSSG